MVKIVPAGKKAKSISNKNVHLTVDSLGAKALYLKVNNNDILYYQPTDIQHSGIPICFPYFGPLKNGVLQIEGKKYPMNQHGFFREMEFELISKKNKITAVLNSSQETLNIYPYHFTFHIIFKLLHNGINISVNLINEDNKEMIIAPGFHPYFHAQDTDNITFTTDSERGNDSLSGGIEIPIEDSGVFEIANREKTHKILRIINSPDIQLIKHTLDKTEIHPGKKYKIILSADMNLFNRLTIWRKNPHVQYICFEPSFQENSINKGNGIILKKNQSFKTEIEISINE